MDDKFIPKFLTLADIKVGQKYVELSCMQNGVIFSSVLEVLGEPYTVESELCFDVLLSHPGGGYDEVILARDAGLILDDKYDNGHRTFCATPEIIELIEGIVLRQDRMAYKELTGHTIVERDELDSNKWKWSDYRDLCE